MCPFVCVCERELERERESERDRDRGRRVSGNVRCIHGMQEDKQKDIVGSEIYPHFDFCGHVFNQDQFTQYIFFAVFIFPDT